MWVVSRYSIFLHLPKTGLACTHTQLYIINMAVIKTAVFTKCIVFICVYCILQLFLYNTRQFAVKWFAVCANSANMQYQRIFCNAKSSVNISFCINCSTNHRNAYLHIWSIFCIAGWVIKFKKMHFSDMSCLVTVGQQGDLADQQDDLSPAMLLVTSILLINCRDRKRLEHRCPCTFLWNSYWLCECIPFPINFWPSPLPWTRKCT